jgi:hypothetical protein
MRLTLSTVAALALVACTKQAEAPPADNAVDANTVTVNSVVTNAAVTPAAATNDYRESSWEFVFKGKPMLESIDANMNYITVSGDKHQDHGTAVVKGTKICFTSATTKDGEDCWQDPKLEIGQSGESVSDKGEKAMLKRVAYKPLSL